MKDTAKTAVIPGVTAVTSDADQDVLVYYCSWDGRTKRVKTRELDQVEHGGFRRRYCKSCEAITTHAVVTATEADDDAVMVEVLVRALNWQGVVVRRSIRDDGYYGVQINRYDGTGWDGDKQDDPTGTEVMLCGPVAAIELVGPLQDACRMADAGNEQFSGYNLGKGILGEWFEARPGKSEFWARLRLHWVFGLPAEVSEPPYPPFRLFADKLRDLLSPTEREALVLVLTGQESDLDLQQQAALQRPFAAHVSTSHVRDTRPGSELTMYRNEAPDVIW